MQAHYDVVTPQFRQTPLFLHQDEPWNHEQALQGIPIDRLDLSIQQNYEHEAQYSSSTSRWIDDYRMRYSYPSFETGHNIYYVPGIVSHAYPNLQRSCSPSNSATSPSQFSSSYSDRQSTPLSSPTPSLPAYSPYFGRDEILPFCYGGQAVVSDEKQDMSGPCVVAMQDVQNYADTETDKDAFDDDHDAYYASYIQEGYHPMQNSSEESEAIPSAHDAASYIEAYRPETPHIRRRRPQVTRVATAPQVSSKVSKRSNGSKRAASYHSKSHNDKCSGHKHANPNRAFPCPFAIYGCASTFGSKNEWKRHVNTQHMRLGYWRCDLCDQEDRKPNDFNRKDLFIQHVRRMHPSEEKPKALKAKSANTKSTKNDPEEQALAAAASRCWRHIRSPPDESGCLFCDVTFNGAGSWDERLEHIGRHMESAKKDSSETVHPREWQKDVALEEWLAREEIIIDSKDGYTLAEGGARDT